MQIQNAHLQYTWISWELFLAQQAFLKDKAI